MKSRSRNKGATHERRKSPAPAGTRRHAGRGDHAEIRWALLREARDWAAFEDAKIEGYKRAQHRFIGAGGSGKHDDPSVIPAKNFTLSIMFVPPGQGNAAHTHEVEECFFVLQGHLDVFCEDETGKRITTRLGPWECIACPAGVIHGYQNDSLDRCISR